MSARIRPSTSASPTHPMPTLVPRLLQTTPVSCGEADQWPYTLRRFTIEEYEATIEAGILYSGEPVELLNGLTTEMATVGSRPAA